MNWKLESQRDEFGKVLVELGKKYENIVVCSADLTESTKLLLFSRYFPNRFFNFGIAEQNMIGASAGFALSGKIVIAATFAVFASGRAYDFVRQCIAYNNANVKIIATHSGITVGGDGASHQATEDIALMRVLPNMKIVVPCDTPETIKALNEIIENKSPIYMRICRQKVPTITTDEHTFKLGKSNILRDGEDITLIGTGYMVSKCLLASEILEKNSIYARVVNMSTVKPIDEEIIIKSARDTGAIITAEDHSIIGGLGGAVAEVLSENLPTKMYRIGVKDKFGESGESEEVLKKFGMTEHDIVLAACELVKNK